MTCPALQFSHVPVEAILYSDFNRSDWTHEIPSSTQQDLHEKAAISR